MRSLWLMVAVTTVASAIASGAPPTSPEHPERDYVPIGGGLYMGAGELPQTDYSNGNVIVRVYSRVRPTVGAHYSFDVGVLQGVPAYHYKFDAGKLGTFVDTDITIDCKEMTYEIVDTRKLLPDAIWRAASTLPALAPVFHYGCSKDSLIYRPHLMQN